MSMSFLGRSTLPCCVLRENEVDAQWLSVHSLLSCFNSCNSVCTQVAIMGFWEAHVRCDELPPSVNREFKGGWGR